MHGKEKEMLESEAKEKVAKRSTCLEKVSQIQIQIAAAQGRATGDVFILFETKTKN